MNKHMMCRFHEDIYLPKKDIVKDYFTRVSNGIDMMSNSTACFILLARDIEKIAQITVARLEQLGSMFLAYNIVIYENDSTDNTKLILKQLAAKNYRITVINDTVGCRHTEKDKSLSRRIRMANARNNAKDIALNICRSYNYFIVMDSDLTGGFSYEGIANSISYGYDVTCSNSIIYDNSMDKPRRLYYDSWAYRELNHPHEHTDEYANTRIFHRGEQPFQVLSAFGGCAIYNNKSFANNYRYTEDDCDHVTLHKQLHIAGYNIYLNPSQITLYNPPFHFIDWET